MSTVSGSAVDPRCVAWCRHKVKLLGADVNALWRPERHDAACVAFLAGADGDTAKRNADKDTKRLFMYVEVNAGKGDTGGTAGTLRVQSAVPLAGSWTKLIALVRDPSSLVQGGVPVTKPVTFASCPTLVHVSCVDNDVAGSLLKTIKGVYAPPLLRNESWPESVRNDLKTHTHAYLAQLTERSFSMKGKTVLYVPDEPDILGTAGADANDNENSSVDGDHDHDHASFTRKDLVQRLETTVIHWTRQIREVLRKTACAGGGRVKGGEWDGGWDASSVGSGKGTGDGSDANATGTNPSSANSSGNSPINDGPLSEVSFWHARAADLAGIQLQLDAPGVGRVVMVLKRVGSTYLEPFVALRAALTSESAAAFDNAKFLKTLVEPCVALANASAKEVGPLMPGISHRVRLVWNSSEHYNKPERVFGLLRKISNEVTRRCASAVVVGDILDGNVLDASEALRASLEACDAWKTSFEFTRVAVNKRHAAEEKMQWRWSPTSLFARLDAFEQRCKDLLVVCDAQTQFAPKTPVPVFGGSQGVEIRKSFSDIRESFQVLNVSFSKQGAAQNALDVTASAWHDDFNNFIAKVKDLQVRFTNVMTNAVDGVRGDLGSFVERVDALRLMSPVGDSSSPIGRCADRLTNELITAFAKELATTKEHFDTYREKPPTHPSMPRRAGAAAWALSQHNRLLVPWQRLDVASKAWYGVSSSDSKKGNVSVSNSQTEFHALRAAYVAALPSFEKYAKEQHGAWVVHVENKITPSLRQRLENRLLTFRDAGDGADVDAFAATTEDGIETADGENAATGSPKGLHLLKVNFDDALLIASEETKHFERMYFQIPSTCSTLAGNREKYRQMREEVLTLVTRYNALVSRLDTQERKLFRDRLGALDKKIAPGLQKVSWQSSKSVLEFFGAEALKQVVDTTAQVDVFKLAMAEVKRGCETIARTRLTAQTKGRVYGEGEFSAAQAERIAEAGESFTTCRAQMDATLKKTWKTIFNRDSRFVQNQWRLLLRRVDAQILTSLRLAVKNALRDVSRALHGDAKTKEVTPLFGVAAVLSNTGATGSITGDTTASAYGDTTVSAYGDTTGGASGDTTVSAYGDTPTTTKPFPRVTLKPAVSDIRAVLKQTCADVIEVTKLVDKFVVWSGGGDDDSDDETELCDSDARKTFHEIIASDETETAKRVAAVDDGASLVTTVAAKFENKWLDAYGAVWAVDKEFTIQNYGTENHTLSEFETSIAKFRDLANDVRGEQKTEHMRFLKVDCEPLADAIAALCEAWSESFLRLLNDTARRELEALYMYFDDGSTELRAPPRVLEALADKVSMHKRFLRERDVTHAKFAPIKAQYAALEKFEWRGVTFLESTQLTGLDNAWLKFVDMISETEVSLEEHKEGFRDKLNRMVDTLIRDVDEFYAVFVATAPKNVTGAVTHANLTLALKSLSDFNGTVQKLTDREHELKKGLDIFNLPSLKLTPLGVVEMEIGGLTAVWELVKTWLGEYDVWSLGKFRDLRVEEMENTATQINKNVVKLGKKINGDDNNNEWVTWRSLKHTIDGFKKTMPLITDLRNPAIRERHWALVMEKCGVQFDPHGDDFTLGRVTDLALHTIDVFISELSGNATKELAIELALVAIKETWTGLKMDMVPFKDDRPDVFKLRGTEDAYVALEDNIVTLSTMKASKFFTVFEQPITNWERKLLLVSEMLDLVQKVQTAWMYLENIFLGSEDIRKQLPLESVVFDEVNAAFIEEMRGMKNKGLIVTACTGSKPDATTPVSQVALEKFTAMDSKLEKIQKSLEAYLEQKRQQFPRFYFISSDDLLEILGQAKDPLNVQPHFKGMFEGVKKLEMMSPGEGGRRNYAATLMHSPDGETLNFDEEVPTFGRPEEWLNKVEHAMYKACRTSLKDTLEQSKGMKKEKWVKQFPGQMIISAGCVVWTAECEKALADKDKAKASVKMLKKKWVSYLAKLVTLTRSKLDKVNRKKVVALITIEVHARDSIEKLLRSGCDAITDFEWVSQLRFYWDAEKDDCVVKQVLSVFEYGYEYQGNNGRLVVTPLTDRCYMTLGAAMFTRRGGNPLGPAGTGKTETVKDFGKALARYVIVFNCSDGVDYKMTAKMFAGLAQTGAWACLDEFNRISVEVLSVVATQISEIMAAVKKRAKMFWFEGQNIRLIPSCGVFVTMNPGYAGRAELPDNLKAIVRPVSMMVPDFSLIAEIMMFAEGFSSAKSLAKKMVAIMELSQQQLSKQDHYDYTLRSFVIPISRAAGAHKRVDPEGSEEAILYRTMQDLIMPKLVYLDIPLFRALLGDLFPGVDQPPDPGGVLKDMLQRKCLELGLQVVDDWIVKIIQIFDCKVARHGNMIVGKTGSGKSSAWRVLRAAMAQLCEDGVGDGEYQKVEVFTINPLALSNDEIYGCFDSGTHEWTDGILARVMRTICKDESQQQKWTLFDGPVDTLWIESMNTLLDDNKLLTLLSGERIMMSPQVSILFEVEDLSQASPATVSRAGMIYLNVEDLGWWPFATSWLESLTKKFSDDKVVTPIVKTLLEKWMENALEFRRLKCGQLVETDKLAAVRQFTVLFDSLRGDTTGSSGLDPGLYSEEPDTYTQMLEKQFVYCLVWSVGASLDDESRKKFDRFVRENENSLPPSHTVYEYFVDHKLRDWSLWETRLTNYKPPNETPFFRIMVPTVDTLRTKTVALALATAQTHVLIVGRVGVGKSMVCGKILEELPSGYNSCAVNFSAQTSSNSLQDTIEGKLEKRSKGTFAPPGGKRTVVLCDDFNMPAKSVFGFMPPLELLKLWADNGFWYDRGKQEVKHIKDIQLMASMAPPGGGRNAFSQRIMAVFGTVNMTDPSEGSLKRIYATLLNSHLSQFDDSLKPLGDPIVKATIELYATIAQELLPTPSKSHYLFNTRDLAKVIQGTMQTTPAFYDNKDAVLQLWCHECHRVFGDRMWDANDQKWLRNQLDQKLLHNLGTSWEHLFEPFYGECPPFVSFMRVVDDGDPPYEPVIDNRRLKETLHEKLEEYALEPGHTAMDLVLFQDALLHVCRIHRVLMQPRGNALLVGVGGSGRKSLARLATYVADLKCFAIEITKNYKLVEFREDLKDLFRITGVQNKPTVFLFDETQIVVETFLEDINNVLTSGEVPNLFAKDELGGLCEDVRAEAKLANAGETQDDLYAFFLGRVIKNLHIVLCMSPIGDSFRERTRMFPGLVNCCTIDWFNEWPGDALIEVAKKQMESETEMADDVKESLCKVFATCHRSTSEKSQEMLQTLRRKNYVTPTNYLEFVNGYRRLLTEKRTQIGGMANKLRGGVLKLDETSVQVGEMTIIAEEKQVVVAAAKVECESLLVTIIADKRVADDQEKQVSAEAAKIGRDAEDANQIAAECQAGLDLAMPALEAAQNALNVLTKKDMSELKAYSKPPALVELCLKGVMTVLKKSPTWDAAKKALGDSQFLNGLMNFDKDKLDDALLGKMRKYINDPEYTPEKVGAVSGAAKGLCQWVHAMFIYGNVAKEVAPKRARLKAAQEALKKKQEALREAEKKLKLVLDKVQALKDTYEVSTSNKKALEDELADLEAKLTRAEKLVNGLGGEKTRWVESIGRYETQITALPGDVVIAAAFMSYAGPFPSEFRDALVQKTWLPQVTALGIPASQNFDFSMFLADPSDVRDWNIDGLPADSFSTENGVVVTRGTRWPLLIDPQGQGNKWIRNMEKKNGRLVVLTLTMPDMVRRMENAIQFGDPVLIQDVQEEIDPILEPVLSKAFIKKGNSLAIKLGDKEVDYDPKFRLYLTSKLNNPHYTPEVSTKVTIVNFAVKEQGLEAQLLNVVVQKERPDLDTQKNDLVRKVAHGKRTLFELEDQLLDLLSNATGSLLDNTTLINTLNDSKITSDEVAESLVIAEKTGKKIESASALYKPCSARASILYFVLYDLANVDPMYQFSLDAYVDLFLLSIKNAPKSTRLDERIKFLNEFHTYATYKYTSRGLFEQHKLLLSLQMCVRILKSADSLNDTEWRFFLRGGAVLDRSDQPTNPAPGWISELAWDNVVELEQQVPHFLGITSHFEQNVTDWERWYRLSEPENATGGAESKLPGDWESKCDALQRMLVVRCLRMDRVEKAVASYVAGVLGRKYVEPPTLDLNATHADSTNTTPLIFVLSPGVDPTANLKQLALAQGVGDKFFSVALGQGQAPVATKLIETATREGNWVFLANCHLMLSWLPTLQKIIENLEDTKPHETFRLWLSSNPTPHFPLAILQRGLKMTTEPPKGLRANLARLYQTCVTDESFAECKTSGKYAKLLFSLTYFHAVMLERRKFRELGINIPYDFNDTDYSVSDDVLKAYLDAYEDTPWDALKYLISEANYGGRVTDEIDRRVLSGYLNQYFCEDALVVPNFRLSTLEEYFVPNEGSLNSYKEYIATLPISDQPEAFGQHPNADISYMITDSTITLESCVALQPKSGDAGGGGGGGKAIESLVTQLCDDMLASTPLPFDHEQLMKDKALDPSPLHVTLFQEVERYNVLINNVLSTLKLLKKGIKGLVVMSADLDAVFHALANNKVPGLYLKAYPSLKPLGSWTRDLQLRLLQIKNWITGTYPKTYWLAGFTYPSCFLTAVLQTTARKNAIPIDTLVFEFQVSNIHSEKELPKDPPKEGVFVKEMFLEGAGWDMENLCLCEPNPMELVVDMPITLFKPVENKAGETSSSSKKDGKKGATKGKGTYQCPLYMYPVRTGSRERPSFMIMVDLKSGAGDSDFWIKRGTALLLSLAT